jgi:hypothetical protein
MTSYRIMMEDAGRYLPHDPTGCEYQHYVYGDQMVPHPLTGQPQPELVFSGTRAECETFVAACNLREQSR